MDKETYQQYSNYLYQLNNITNDLESHFNGVNLNNIVFNNVDDIKNEYEINNSGMLKIWNFHAERRRQMYCQHCGIREVSVPNQISSMVRNRMNHHKSISKYLPNGIFVIRDNSQKLELDQMMLDKNREEKKEIWKYLQAEMNVNKKDLFNVVCYDCYNYPKDITPTTNIEEYTQALYKYIVPYLIIKNKCLFNCKGSFCSKEVFGSNMFNYTDISPETKEEYLNIKKEIIKNNLTGYNNNKNLFICYKHIDKFP